MDYQKLIKYFVLFTIPQLVALTWFSLTLLDNNFLRLFQFFRDKFIIQIRDFFSVFRFANLLILELEMLSGILVHFYNLSVDGPLFLIIIKSYALNNSGISR